MAKYVILGAGMTGLSAAYHLKKEYFLAEKEREIGGLSGSIVKNGFTFDHAEHFLRIPDRKMENFFKKLMGENLFSQELISAIYYKNKFIPYPFQENIRTLPVKELKKCAKSLILNYFSRNQNKTKFANFEEFNYYNYGEYIANEFMIPYNEKIWQFKPSEMNTSWFLSPDFIPSFNLNRILNSILPLSDDIPIKKFYRWYPIKGGSQEFANSFFPYLLHLTLNCKAIKIDLNEKLVIFQNGHSEHYEHLISTIALPDLLNIIDSLPSSINGLIPSLKYNSVYCMNLALTRENDHRYHWLYFPQKEIPFSRLFFSSNFSKNNAPIGKGTCSALTTFLPNSNFNESKFEEKSLQILFKLGFLKNESEIIEKIPLKIKFGFPIPTIGLEKKLKLIQDFLKDHDIYSIGRYGEWKYAGIEHSIKDGALIAQKLI